MVIPASIIATVLFAAAGGWFAWALTNLSSKTATANLLSPLEKERREQIRKANKTYLYFEPLIDELASVNRHLIDVRQLDELNHKLKLSSPVPWNALEFVSCKQLEGIFAGSIVALISLLMAGMIPALVIGVVVAVFFVYSAINSTKRNASDRVKVIKRRLPFAVDLIALMLQAGASFQECLRTALRENAAHPLGEELGTVISEIEMGRSRRMALEDLRTRLDDPDVAELVSAINKGEELGTPLSTIMRTQADQMRLKRSQWGEKAAAEAHVKMTFPAMVVMLACMLLIVAPFLLSLSQMF